jgi:hypothetical protein
MAEAKTTTDHAEIRRWAEARGGRPAHVTETGEGDDPGVLRIDFEGPDDRLEEISWDDWFRSFEENRLAFLYQDEADSRFNKLVDRPNTNGNG